MKGMYVCMTHCSDHMFVQLYTSCLCSSCHSLLVWLVRVLVNGEVAVSEASSPLPPLDQSAPPTHSRLLALLTAVLGAATKPV